MLMCQGKDVLVCSFRGILSKKHWKRNVLPGTQSITEFQDGSRKEGDKGL